MNIWIYLRSIGLILGHTPQTELTTPPLWS